MGNFGRNIFKFGKMTKPVAYLLGVYFSDGYVSMLPDYGKYVLGLDVIDKDFAESFVDAIDKTFGKQPSISTRQRSDWEGLAARHAVSGKPQLQYRTAFCSKSFCSWILETTAEKTRIPKFLMESSIACKREFIAGLMDGDGWMSQTPMRGYPGHYMYQMGLAGGHSEWFDSAIRLMQSIGIVGKKGYQDQYEDYEPQQRYMINIRSYVEAGCYFKINRKQERLEQYIKDVKPQYGQIRKAHHSPSETIRLAPSGNKHEG